MLTEFKMGLIWQEHKEHGKLSSMVNSVRAVILPEDIEDLRAVTVIWTVGSCLQKVENLDRILRQRATKRTEKPKHKASGFGESVNGFSIAVTHA